MTHIHIVNANEYGRLLNKECHAIVWDSDTMNLDEGDELIIQNKDRMRQQHRFRITDVWEIEVHGSDAWLVYLDEPIQRY